MAKVKLSKSGVPWTDYSWGVVDGCTKVSEACQNCYAESYAHRFWGDRKFSNVRTHPERLEAPLNTKKPGKVFVAPLGDLFHPEVPFEFIDKVFAVIAMCKEHTFQILTKRPERMRRYFERSLLGSFIGQSIWEVAAGTEYDSPCLGCLEDDLTNLDPWPLPNLWLGVTAENQEQADKRIPILLQIPAAVRFISVEPMLSEIKLRNEWICRCRIDELPDDVRKPVYDLKEVFENNLLQPAQGIDWVICGGESGSKARPMHPDWVRSLKDQCQAANVPFYFKSWGEYAPYSVEKESAFCKTIAFLKTGEVKTVSYDEFNYYNNRNITSAIMSRFGTKKAGCLLDGVEYKQMPEVGK